MIEGTVHRVFRSTSTWEDHDKAMEINRKQWLINQYPESRQSQIALQALGKIIREGKNKGKKRIESQYSQNCRTVKFLKLLQDH